MFLLLRQITDFLVINKKRKETFNISISSILRRRKLTLPFSHHQQDPIFFCNVHTAEGIISPRWYQDAFTTTQPA